MTEQAQTMEQIIIDWNDRLGQLADALTSAAKEYGPDAIELAFAATSLSCVGNIMFGIGAGVVAYLAYRFARTHFQAVAAISKEGGREYMNDDEMPHVICAVVSSVVSFVTSIISAIQLLDIWNWAGILWPQLYIAHKLLGL